MPVCMCGTYSSNLHEKPVVGQSTLLIISCSLLLAGLKRSDLDLFIS